jgi:hypothetical protein
MANDITLHQGVGGPDVATVERQTRHHQRVLVELDDTGSRDAFGRLRVSNPTTLFESKLLGGDKAPLFWDESLISGAGISSSTPTVAKPYTDITSTLNTAGRFVRQTFRCFNYQPGKSQLFLLTGVLDLSGGGTGVERRIGTFNDNDGAFFEINDTTVGVTVRSNDSGTPVDDTVTQANWNIDVMDGTGPSGITADFTNAQIFVIDWQWLSVGRVRFGLEIDGELYYVHEYLSANASATPWSSTPNLPIRDEMITTASSPASSMRAICVAVISEGGTDDIGVVRYASTGGTHIDADTENTIYAVVGIRLKSTHLGATIQLLDANLLVVTSADAGEWLILFNPTVAGTFTYADETNSAVQVARGSGNTNTVTDGTPTGGGFLAAGGGGLGKGADSKVLMNELALGAAIDGTRDTLVLCFRPVGGSTAVDVEGSLTWRETF